MMKKKALSAVLLVIAAFVIQGCAGTKAEKGGETATYVEGRLEVVEPKDLQTVYAAAEMAAVELELKIIKSSEDANSAVIETRDTEGRKVAINLQTVGERATGISIQVSSSEGERKSRLIYQKIREYLQKK